LTKAKSNTKDWDPYGFGLWRKQYVNYPEGRRINRVSEGAECLFFRLNVRADDFGNIPADPDLLKARVAPKKGWTSEQIQGWLKELAGNNLIELYEDDGEPFAHLIDFTKRQAAISGNGRRQSSHPVPAHQQEELKREQEKWRKGAERGKEEDDGGSAGDNKNRKEEEKTTSAGDDAKAPETSDRAPLRLGNPIYDKLKARMGRDLRLNEDRDFCAIARRLDVDPVKVDGKVIDTEVILLAAIPQIDPGADFPVRYLAGIVDNHRNSGTMPGTDKPKGKKKPLTLPELCEALNAGKITQCDGQPVPKGKWTYNTERLAVDGAAFKLAGEIGGSSWA
jgi:hypothetical protein